MSHFLFNDKFFPANDLIIGADNRGLRFGDGLFETIRFNNGKLELELLHFERLWTGMKILGFEIPAHLAPAYLADRALELCKKNGHLLLSRVRITVFRSDGGLNDPIDMHPNWLIQTWPLPEHSGEWNINGLTLGIYDAVKKPIDILSNLKHNNFLPYVMAAMNAKKEKWNDALIMNSDHRICESSIANVFLVKNEKIYTPALKEGCVAGVMRATLLQFLRTNSYPVFETAITADELLAADEVFLTNSIHPIRWVKSVNNKDFNNSLTQKIYEAFVPTIC